jgi:hypothetical protein
MYVRLYYGKIFPLKMQRLIFTIYHAKLWKYQPKPVQYATSFSAQQYLITVTHAGSAKGRDIGNSITASTTRTRRAPSSKRW